MSGIGFIGGGKMAEAMIGGLIRSKVASPADIHVSDISEERRKALQSRHGIRTYADNAAVAAACQTVFLAVKPQQLAELLGALAGLFTAKHLVLSIAAGKRLVFFESRLPAARVIRVMPNLGVLASEGMSVFCAGARATADDRRTATALLTSFGRALELPEEQFDAVTALSGSGPAYFAQFLNLMAEAGAQLGLTKEDALLLATQTLFGAATLIAKGLYTPDDLIKAVSSEKGTTVAGMAVLKDSPIAKIVADTLAAATRRSEELSRG
jgi:pyrroline-5-carboxylate reductase